MFCPFCPPCLIRVRRTNEEERKKKSKKRKEKKKRVLDKKKLSFDPIMNLRPLTPKARIILPNQMSICLPLFVMFD